MATCDNFKYQFMDTIFSKQLPLRGNIKFFFSAPVNVIWYNIYIISIITLGPIKDKNTLQVLLFFYFAVPQLSGFPVGNPILGCKVLGHFSHILGHFVRNDIGEGGLHWGGLIIFMKFTLFQSNYWQNVHVDIVSKKNLILPRISRDLRTWNGIHELIYENEVYTLFQSNYWYDVDTRALPLPRGSSQ